MKPGLKPKNAEPGDREELQEVEEKGSVIGDRGIRSPYNSDNFSSGELTTARKEDVLARKAKGYKGEKRKREVKRQKKQEEKRLRRQNKSGSSSLQTDESSTYMERENKDPEFQGDRE